MENRKYEMTNITMEFEERTLYRIRALKNFRNVKAGDLGGWVSDKYNLSQEGECWIYDEAKCMDNARMYHNSAMYNNSVMCDFSEMHGCSEMHNYSAMCDNSRMYNCSAMYDNSRIYNDSKMYNNSRMFDNSAMYNNAVMLDNSKMFENSRMYRDSRLKNKEKLCGKLVTKVDRFIEINNTGGRVVTGVLKDGKILYNIGCQNEITKEVFIDRIYNDDGGIEEHPYRKEYLKIIKMIESYLLEQI